MRAFESLALVALLILCASAGDARAEPLVMRMATLAPEGTGWARELKAFAREVESGTFGDVRIKWYFGGIAGDEVQMGERVRRQQLDGVASGGMLCSRLAPSMRVMRVLGLFQSRDESAFVMNRLSGVLDREFASEGFTNLAEVGIGPAIFFTRTPVHSLAELKQLRIWIWDLEDLLRPQLTSIGVKTVALSPEAAARAYDDGKIDGFLATPSAALAFQWTRQARYLIDLRTRFLTACLIVANRTFDQLSIVDQQVLRSSGAKLRVRMEELGRREDEALLGGLLARQGLEPVPVSASFRTRFYEAARQARDQLGERLLPKWLMNQVLGLLADFRAERAATGAGQEP